MQQPQRADTLGIVLGQQCFSYKGFILYSRSINLMHVSSPITHLPFGLSSPSIMISFKLAAFLSIVVPSPNYHIWAASVETDYPGEEL